MSVFLDGRPIHSGESLSETCQLAIAFIDGGTDWLMWAMASPHHRFAFADETEMAGGIQQGLHANPFALLPHLGLMVSPIKLMTLSVADLQTLARAETGDGSAKVGARIDKVLTQHHILTQADFAAGQKYLNELAVDTKPVFQFMTFQDQVAAYSLVGDGSDDPDPPAALQSEAADFAVTQARTVPEFVDYYRIYLALAAKPGAPSSQTKRLANAEAVIHTLLPLMFGSLECPVVDGLVGPAAVAEAVRVWLAMDRSLGFQRASAGVRDIVEFTPYRQETGFQALEIVKQYQQAASRFLTAVPPRRGIMGQDGATCVFPLEGEEHQGSLQLDAGGLISLIGFRKKPKPHPQKPARQSAPEPETA